QGLPVGGVMQVGDAVRVPLRGAQRLAGRHVPGVQYAALAPGDQDLSVAREGDPVDRPARPVEAAQLLPRARIPQPYRPVLTAGGQRAAPRGEGRAVDGPLARVEGADALPRGQIDEMQGGEVAGHG